MCVFVCDWPQKRKSQYPGISLISLHIYISHINLYLHISRPHHARASRKSQDLEALGRRNNILNPKP